MNHARTRIDWDADVSKHYVRRRAWLPAALAQVEASRRSGRQPKYLTFCAANAIDVFLFLKEGVISRDRHTDVVQDTYFCERYDEEFNEISQLIGAHEQGFLGDFKDIVLYQDDEETRCLDYDDATQRFSRSVRGRLDTRKKQRRLKNLAPFDLLNLDICGTFFPPSTGVQSPMLRSIRTLLEWQTESATEEGESIDSFTVFVTAHMESGRVNADAMCTLVRMIETNRDAYAGFSEKLLQRFGTQDPGQIADGNFEGFYGVALPKVIISDAFNRGWRAETEFSGWYRRNRELPDGQVGSTYSMLTWVGRFRRMECSGADLGRVDSQVDRLYAAAIREVTKEPEDVDLAVRSVEEEMRADLKTVVEFREEYHAGLRGRS